MRGFALVFGLAACGGGAEASDAGTDAAHDALPDALTVEAAPDDAAPPCIVRGNVTDMSDQAWAGATLLVCSASLCTIGHANPAGAFAVGVECGKHYHVIARPSATDTRPGSAGLGVLANDVVADVTLTDPVRIPETPNATNLTGGSQAVAVAPDLTLTLDPANVAFYGDKYVAGVKVDLAKGPAFVIPNQTVLAMWALNPWDTNAAPNQSIAVTIANNFGLAANATASLYTVSSTTAELVVAGNATVSSDATALHGTVAHMTWLVLAQ